MSKPHGWVGRLPLGHGSQAVTLCGVTITDVDTIPMEVQDIPVGGRVKLPEGVCSKCRKVEIPKTSERQWIYIVRDSRDRTESQ